MPFSRENVASTLILAAIVLLALVGAGTAMVISLWGGDDSSNKAVYVGGLVIFTLKVLLDAFRTELDRRATRAAAEGQQEELIRRVVAEALAQADEGKGGGGGP